MKQKIAITTDAVIFSTLNNEKIVLLIKRKNNPFQGKWALPGGFLEENETLENGCKRELEEETGLKLSDLNQVGIYDAIGRDPRGRTLSVAFTKTIQKPEKVKGNDDAAEAKWIPLKELDNLAFDHRQIIADALEIG